MKITKKIIYQVVKWGKPVIKINGYVLTPGDFASIKIEFRKMLMKKYRPPYTVTFNGYHQFKRITFPDGFIISHKDIMNDFFQEFIK